MAKSIGIISKPEHAKGLVKALAATTYNPTILGDDPTSLPSSFDVIVVRVKSCSHGASRLASEELRQGTRPILFENGSDRVVESLKEIDAGTYTQAPVPTNLNVVESPQRANSATKTKTKTKTVRDSLETVIEQGGFYFTKMRERSPSQCIDLMQGVGTIRGRKAAAAASTALEQIEVASASNIPGLLSKLRKSDKYMEQKLWTPVDSKKRTRSVFLLAYKLLSSPQLERLAELSGLFPSKAAALIAAGVTPKRSKPLNTTPVKGRRHTAKYSGKDESWIVYSKGTRKPLDIFHLREEAREAVNMLDDAKAPEESPEESPEEVLPGKLIGNYHRAYPSCAKTQPAYTFRWSFQRKGKHLRSFTGTAESAQKLMDEIDAEYAYERSLVTTEPQVEPPQPEPGTDEGDEHRADLEFAYDVLGSFQEKELEGIIDLLIAQMGKMRTVSYRHKGAAVQVTLVHFRHKSGPKACERSLIGPFEGMATAKLSDVTCPQCQESPWYAAVQWALANATA